MDLFSLIGELTVTIAKHGISATTLALGIALILRQLLRSTPFKRMVMRYLPKKLRKIDLQMGDMKSDIRRIEAKLDAIARHMGVSEWAVPLPGGRPAQSLTAGAERNSWSSQAGLWRVRITALFTQKKKATFHLYGRFQKMKSKLFSRKFLMALATGLLIVANDGLDLGLDKDTILMVVSVIGGWIFVEGAKDTAVVVKEKKQAEVQQAYHGE